MARAQTSINLIRTKTSGSPELGSIEQSLRRSGYIGLFAFLCMGVVVGVVYYFFYQENTTLTQTKTTLEMQVDAQKQKEGMYLAIQDRTGVIGSVLSGQRPWVKVLDRINTFVSPPELTSIAVDDQNKIILSITTSSLDSVMSVVNAVIAEAKANHFVNPQLLSLQIGNKGVVQVSIAFFALFQNL